MRFHRTFMSIAAAFVLFARAVDCAVMAAVQFIASLMPASPQRLNFSGQPRLGLTVGGTALEPSLLQSLRHESKARRTGVPRNI